MRWRQDGKEPSATFEDKGIASTTRTIDRYLRVRVEHKWAKHK